MNKIHKGKWKDTYSEINMLTPSKKIATRALILEGPTHCAITSGLYIKANQIYKGYS